MSLLQPSGKRRYVKAQGINNYDLGDSFFTDTAPEGSTAPQGIGQELGSLFDQESAIQDQQEDDQSSTDTDILDYIMKKLESFGYPPRRLNDFKDEFVSEKLLPGSARDVSVTFPDMYYGKGKRLNREDISKITEDIQNNFDLTFTDGERKDKKVFLNFVSKGQEGETEEEEGMGDELDVAFGGESQQNSNSKSKSKKKKSASTQQEMMKLSMLSAFDKINKRG